MVVATAVAVDIGHVPFKLEKKISMMEEVKILFDCVV